MASDKLNNCPNAVAGASRTVEVHRYYPQKHIAVEESVHLVMETFLSLWIEDVGRYVLVCSPGNTQALALGFALSEGIISTMEDVISIGHRLGDPTSIEMRVRDPQAAAPGRNLLMTSSCGVCGTRNLEKYLTGDVASKCSLQVGGKVLLDVARQMRVQQQLFSRTGGAHAAALFGADGRIVALAEDIGRHNALDKVVGLCLEQGLQTAGRGAMLSGRVSFEIVAKAARAGLELIGGVSAPSSLALEVAERCRITLCGFVRSDRLTVYTHAGRVTP